MTRIKTTDFFLVGLAPEMLATDLADYLARPAAARRPLPRRASLSLPSFSAHISCPCARLPLSPRVHARAFRSGCAQVRKGVPFRETHHVAGEARPEQNPRPALCGAHS